MTFKRFIAVYKEEIDQAIHRIVPDERLNNEARRIWILNDEGLYRWARSEGVRI